MMPPRTDLSHVIQLTNGQMPHACSEASARGGFCRVFRGEWPPERTPITVECSCSCHITVESERAGALVEALGEPRMARLWSNRDFAGEMFAPLPKLPGSEPPIWLVSPDRGELGSGEQDE